MRPAASGFTRRAALVAFAASGPMLAAGTPAEAQAVSDVDIFNFALNLEYLEAEYYNRGVTGEGLSAADTGPSAGPVNGGRRVPFANPLIRTFAEELAYNELAHVRHSRLYFSSAISWRALHRHPANSALPTFVASCSGSSPSAGMVINYVVVNSRTWRSVARIWHSEMLITGRQLSSAVLHSVRGVF